MKNERLHEQKGSGHLETSGELSQGLCGGVPRERIPECSFEVVASVLLVPRSGEGKGFSGLSVLVRPESLNQLSL